MKHFIILIIIFLTLPAYAKNIQDWAKEREVKAMIKKVKTKYGARIKEISKKEKVAEKYIISIIVIESNGKPDAISCSKAKGLMQVKVATAKEQGVKAKHIFHPYYNILAGTRYFKKQLERFNNSFEYALAAYNLGPNSKKLKQKDFQVSEMFYIKKAKYVLDFL